VLTTFLSYCNVARRRQGQIIQSLATTQAQPRGDAEDVAQAVPQEMHGADFLAGHG